MIGTGIIKITIGEDPLEIDVNEEAAIHELSADMDNVSARIAFYGEVLAAASEEKIRVDAAYRNWRAKMSSDILAKDDKLAEWKAKARIESEQAFSDYKSAIAKTEYNVTALTNLILALKEKSPNLRSKGARERAELDSTGMTTKASDEANRNMETIRTINLSGSTKKQPLHKKGE